MSSLSATLALGGATESSLTAPPSSTSGAAGLAAGTSGIQGNSDLQARLARIRGAK